MTTTKSTSREQKCEKLKQFHLWMKDWDDKWIWKTAFKPHSSSSCTQTDIFPIFIFFLLSCCKIITCSYSEPFLWLKLYKQLIHLPHQQRRKCLSVFRYTWTVAIFQEKKLLWNIWTDTQKWKAGGCYPMVWKDNVSKYQKSSTLQTIKLSQRTWTMDCMQCS